MEPVRIYDSSSTTGGYLAGLTSASSGLTFKWRREGDSSWTNVTPQSATAGTFTSGGFTAPTSGPTGAYEVHIPNAALTAGVKWCEVEVYGVTNMVPVRLFYELDSIDYQASGGKVPATIAAGDIATDAVTAASVKADAVTKLQAGLMTSAAYTTPPTVVAISMQVVSDLATAHGAGSWATATGFSVPGSAMALTSGERTTLSSTVWSNGTRTLSAFSFTVDANAVMLAASQPNYAPSKAGDAMALTSAERTTLAGIIWNSLTTGMTTAGSIAKRIIDYLTGDIFARLGAPSGANLSADIAAAKSDTLAIKTSTDQLMFSTPNKVDAIAAVSFSEDDLNDLADAIAGQISGATITPLTGTVAVGGVSSSGTVRAYRYCPLGTYVSAIVDSTGAPIDIRGTLKLIASKTTTPATTFILTSDDGELSVGGTDHNQLNINAPASKTAIAGKFSCVAYRQGHVGTDWSVIATLFIDIQDSPDPNG
jgi:hypothetical protein